MRDRMIQFLNNKVINKIGAVVNKSVKEKITPRLDVVLDNIRDQFADVEQEIQDRYFYYL